MKLIWKYLMKYKKWFLLEFYKCIRGLSLVELGIPTIISDMIDHGIEAQIQAIYIVVLELWLSLVL